ncbi:MAG: MFS transporter, partial [Maribacter sp.]
IGMFANSIFQPIIGGWIDNNKAEAVAAGFTGDELELVSGQATLGTMTLFPGILIILFTILYFWMKNRKSQVEVATA